jgi:hypothetical protein
VIGDGATGTPSDAFVGIAQSDYLNATTPIGFMIEGCVEIGVHAESAADVNHIITIGDPLYFSAQSAGTSQLDHGPGTYVGRALEEVASGGEATIKVLLSPRTAPVIANDTTYDMWFIPLPPLTNANTALNFLMTDGWVPGVAGTIQKVTFIPTVASTTEGHIHVAMTIAGTETTGGVINIEDTTVVGDAIAGSAITAANAFTAIQEINVKVMEATAALTEGEGYIIALVSYVHDHS